jgi:uncharacterized membrane protein
MNENVTTQPAASTDTARIVYILYLVGLVVGITAIVGVIMAYVNHDEAPDWLKTHYRFQIRTFWMSLLYGVVSTILCVVLIGFALFVVLAIWLIVRCVKGLKALEQKAPVENVARWGF